MDLIVDLIVDFIVSLTGTITNNKISKWIRIPLLLIIGAIIVYGVLFIFNLL